MFDYETKNIYHIRVRVTDAGGLYFDRAFLIAVTDVNEVPVLAAVPDKTVDELTPLAFSLGATDADVPANTLTFGLVSGPNGLAVSGAGAVAWTPGEAQGPSTNTVVVKVTDSGVPPLSATNSFIVIVREVNKEPANLTGTTVTADGNLRFTVTGTVGGHYAIEWTADFQGWTPVTTNKVPFAFETPLIIGEASRFYRAVAVP